MGLLKILRKTKQREKEKVKEPEKATKLKAKQETTQATELKKEEAQAKKIKVCLDLYTVYGSTTVVVLVDSFN